MARYADRLDAGWNEKQLSLGELPAFPLSTNFLKSPTVYVTKTPVSLPCIFFYIGVPYYYYRYFCPNHLLRYAIS
jgi:hypothetical protein